MKVWTYLAIFGPQDDADGGENESPPKRSPDDDQICGDHSEE